MVQFLDDGPFGFLILVTVHLDDRAVIGRSRSFAERQRDGALNDRPQPDDARHSRRFPAAAPEDQGAQGHEKRRPKKHVMVELAPILHLILQHPQPPCQRKGRPVRANDAEAGPRRLQEGLHRGETARRGLDLDHQRRKHRGEIGVENQPDQKRRGQTLDRPGAKPTAQVRRLRLGQPLPQIVTRHTHSGANHNDAEQEHPEQDTRFIGKKHLLFW